MPSLLPRPSEPVIGKDGRINPTWYRFFAQFERSFGEGLAEGSGIDVDGSVISIATGGVTSAMLRDSPALSVIGRAANSAGAPGDIVAAANDRVLMRSGDVVGFFPLTTATSLSDGDFGDITISGGGTTLAIDNDVVSNAKLANMAQATFKGRAAGAGTGDPTDLTATQAWGVLATATQAITLSGLTIATARLAGRTTAGSGAVEEIGVSAPLTLAAGALGITGAALTRVDDTNVTLTLGGTPASALLAGVSLTLGWTGTLAVARGGTGGGVASGTLLDNITGFSSTGHLVRTGAGTYAFRTITGTANQITVTDGNGVSANPTISLPSAITAPGSLAVTTTFSCNGNATLGDATSDEHAVNGELHIEAANATGGTSGTYALQLLSGGAAAFTAGFDADEAFLQSWAGRTLRINQQGNSVALTADTHVFTAVGASLGGAIAVGSLDVGGEARCDSFRLDQAAVAATPTPTHTFTISLNGTTYRVPCVV